MADTAFRGMRPGGDCKTGIGFVSQKDPKPWTPEHWEVVSISGPSPVFHPTSRIAEWLLVGGMIWVSGRRAAAITAMPPVSMPSSRAASSRPHLIS